mmetsp:Transcript_7103/g.21902  ORF Transcript_7103/g.21902 Transcript_7103/m.21902 type:complete len:220 (-) Transcript_7103:1005-1664(-)
MAATAEQRRRVWGLFLYGSPGSGKSTVAQWLAEHRGFRYAEGDGWLPEDMRERLRERRGFDPEQRDRFAQVIVERLGQLAGESHRPVVVAQALVKRRHRRLVAASHPGLVFVRVTADDAEIERRLRRGANLVDHRLGAEMRRALELDDAEDRDLVLDTTHGLTSFLARLDHILARFLHHRAAPSQRDDGNDDDVRSAAAESEEEGRRDDGGAHSPRSSY